jgi:hypothetical protein
MQTDSNKYILSKNCIVEHQKRTGLLGYFNKGVIETDNNNEVLLLAGLIIKNSFYIEAS